jgi:hypothetical protein
MTLCFRRIQDTTSRSGVLLRLLVFIYFINNLIITIMEIKF